MPMLYGSLRPDELSSAGVQFEAAITMDIAGYAVGDNGRLVWFLRDGFGPIKRVEREPEIEEKPTVDAAALAADLMRLRKNLVP